ncbi:hypothetical protein GCM10010218_01720 [Streptomyces mashuensis]|uniref:Uncharacterized protein n=1 Tax=Streptomyces mashuensis TaxID=33904 RepID=A0A919ATW8_9ACTN|nr:hypothetical protein [Streptomyces mashuensis]GHF24779.1 hypothetical protein GCM10010218_01720 [Streptomyces mashuensis]
MTQEAAPEGAVPAQAASPQSPQPRPSAAAPGSLLQQMEELMAALNADLSQLDADLQSADRAADRNEAGTEPASPQGGTGQG